MKASRKRAKAQSSPTNPDSKKMKLLVTLIVAFVAVEAGAQEIMVRREALPASTVVRLGEVAEIRSADAARGARLARLPLMPAPAAGTKRFVSAREIEDMLAALGEDAKQLRLIGAAQVAVQSPAAAQPAPFQPQFDESTTGNQLRDTLVDGQAAKQMALEQGRVSGVHSLSQGDENLSQSSDSVRELIADYLAEESGNAEGWQIKFNLSDRQQKLIGAATSPVVCSGGQAPWTGNQQFTFSFATANGPVKLVVSAEVMRSQPVIVARRAIPRGAIITAAAVELQQTERPPVANSRRAPLVSIEELIGMEAGRAVQIGEVIFSDQVRAPLVVKRGEPVTVVSQGGGIRVRTTAKATQDGARGDLIQVESLDTREKYDARVTGLREVSVLAPPRTAVDETAGAPEPGAFRRYRSADALPRENVTREATGFRKYLKVDGQPNAQIR
jgi:flagella basal body P-ring formation protein FlgA